MGGRQCWHRNYGAGSASVQASLTKDRIRSNMPIYEYKCDDCNRKVSLFFPSFSAAETRTAAGENKCPQCQSAKLTRMISKASLIRATPSGGGGDLLDPSDHIMDGLNEDDPREIARWARQMKDSMGPELDMGPEFDQAIARIESGEDPDRVMDSLDPEAIGAGAGFGDEDFGDDDDGDDFGPASIGLG